MENTEVASEKHLCHLDAIDFNADGGLLVAASSLTKRLWTGELLYFNDCVRDRTLTECDLAVRLDCGVSDVKWIAATDRCLAACDSGAVELWELTEEKDCLRSVARPVEHDDIVSCVSVNSSSAKFVSAGHDSTVVVWDVEEFLPVSVFRAHYDTVPSAAFHTSNPDIFASCSQDGRVLIWDLRQSKPASLMETQFLQGSLPTCVCWQSGREHSLAVSTETGCILLQDCRVGVGTPDIVHVHTRPVNSLAFAPHRGEWLASASQDCTSAVTSFHTPHHDDDDDDGDGSDRSGCVILRGKAQKDFVQCVRWNPVTYQLASCSWDGTLHCRPVTATSSDCAAQTTDDAAPRSVVHMNHH